MRVLFALQLSFVSVFASVVFEDCGILVSIHTTSEKRLMYSKQMWLCEVFENLGVGSAYDLQSVNIEGCGMRLPCYITLGDDVAVKLEFRAGFESSRFDQNVVLNINQVNLRTDVSPELCDSAACPVRTNGLTSLFHSIMIVRPDIALNQRGYLRWRIFNENGVMVLCYSVLVQTQSPLQKLLRATLGLPRIDRLSYVH